MNRVRLWMCGAAFASFAAGVTVGLVIPGIAAAGSVPTADDVYVADMVADYRLRADQERSLRLILQAWREEEIDVLRSAEAEQLPPPIQRSLLNARSKLEKRVRKLLDAAQLERYEQASRPNDTR